MTMLMMKHFPTFNTTLCPNAVPHAMGPESWHILFRKGVDGLTPLFITLAVNLLLIFIFRTIREAITSRFPKADLTSRKDNHYPLDAHIFSQ